MNKINRFENKAKSTEYPQADLEMFYIEEYLREKGYSINDLRMLPEPETKRFMVEACRYVSLKLAELESRAHLRREIHNATQSP